MSVRKFADETGLAQLNTLLVNKFSGKQDKIATTFTEDLLLVDGTPHSLTEGYYYTGNYHIKINGTANSNFDNTVIFVNNIGDIYALKQNNKYYSIIYEDIDGEGTYGYQYYSDTMINQGMIMTSLPTRDSAIYDKLIPSARLLRTQLLDKYSKPSTGIPKSDLASSVQEILDNAVTSDIPAGAYYGTCDTVATTAEKTVTVDGDWELKKGNLVMIKFDYTNSAQNPTLNVNNTGAKRVWYGTALVSTSNLSYAGYANRPQLFMYDGTNYVFISHSQDNNTTYTNASLGQGYGTCTTATGTQEKAVTLGSYTLTVGGFVAVKFTYAVEANATMNIRTRGAKPIFCNGSAIKDGLIKGTDTAFFIYDGTNYNLLGTIKSSLNSNPVTLYSGSSGGADVTLSEQSSNFRYIEILFSDMIAQSPILNSIKIENPSGKTVSLSVTFAEGGKYYNTFAIVDFSGTTLSVSSFGTLTVNSSGVSSFDGSENNIEILKVVGYRK